MKTSVNSKIFILIALGIFFALLPIITVNLSFIAVNNNNNKCSEYSDDINFDKEYLKISAISGKIHIINNSGWVDFRNAGKCTGNGTHSDPYVIEDLVIEDVYTRSCILIENSDVYFKIENCTLYNSTFPNNGGIQLSNITNSQLIDNICLSNHNGISLLGCNNNTISGNTVNNNNLRGIDLSGCNNNTISGNIVNYNNYGIILSGYNNIISGNIMNNNRFHGIDLSGCNNIISGNIINYSTYGIDLSGCNNILSGNIMNNCGLVINRGSCNELDSHDIDNTNQVNGKPLYYYTNEVNLVENNFTNAGQVILVNCNDSLISNLITSYGTRGISLFYCNNNNIMGNTMNNNHYHGINLYFSDYNTVSGNTINNDDNSGICLSSSDYNTVSGNSANNNEYGISLENSAHNTISGNTANNNHYRGISLGNCHRNIVSENIVNNNEHGIDLYYSDYNTVSGNTANNNEYGIYLLCSDYNTVSGNILLGNDECIKEANCEGNIIENNDCGIIPGYNLFILLGTLLITVVLISKKLKKS